MNQDESPQEASAVAPSQPRGKVPPREPVLIPSPDVLLRHNARVLDPLTAVRIPGQARVRPTVYVGGRLLVRGVVPGSASYEALTEAAARNDVVLDEYKPDVALRSYLARTGADPAVWPMRLVLRPASDRPSPPPDAWVVLQTYRSIVADRTSILPDVALEHLLTASSGPAIGGVPQTHGSGIGGVPQTHGSGLDWGPAAQYTAPGWGGRAPVAWIGPRPTRSPDDMLSCRRPVVAVLDTGIGSHYWFEDGSVRAHITFAGIPIGLTDPQTDAEINGVQDDPLEGLLDPDAGHGTFIAGLIRQKCAEATILAIRVMSGDGVVAEGDLLNAVIALWARQWRAQQTGSVDDFIDVLSLSLGYYHEQPDDLLFDPMLLGPLRALGAAGVAVIASAGNEATTMPFFPAAFAPYPGGVVAAADHDVVPLVSVGARNPNGTTVALFSNAGDWVLCERPGAALVSTFPVTFNASLQPTAAVHMSTGVPRATIDPDDFHGGFGTWSGTSFAAPVLAGEIAQRLFEGECGPIDPLDTVSTVGRSWAALNQLIGLVRP